MELDSMIESAAANGASDLHLESGMPAAVRIRGALRVTGEPIAPRALTELARGLLGEEQWPVFVERRSFDMSRTIRGVRCRINIFQTARGVGLAIRLLSAFQATVEKLNLHPDLKKLVKNTHGLILVSGPTGCGKSSTLAALIQEINLTETRHIITVESPIEYTFRSRRAFIRQREVGRDTPSFEQALLDALREDPDVSRPTSRCRMNARRDRNVYSIGLSTVMMCRVSVRLISWINAASVEDLPQPVGPLTRINPCVFLTSFLRSGCKLSFSTVA